MTNVKENNLKCFEWNVSVTPGHVFTLKSDFFNFQQRKFNFEFCGDYDRLGNNYCILYFESDKILSYSTNILVTITRSKFDEYSKNFTFTSGRQEIWRCRNNFSRISYTVEVIFKADILKETGATSKNGALEENISYLEEKIHFQALSRDFSKLLKEDDDSSDVTITCEGKTFHAHKIILQKRSEVLSAMLKSDMVEGKSGMVTLKDIKLHIFEHFLQYLYTGCLPQLSMDTAMDFYKVGDQYAVEELKMASSEFIIKKLSETNACEILVLSDLHSDKDFRKKVIAYIVEKDIPKHDGNWSDFCERHCILAVQVLNAYITKH